MLFRYLNSNGSALIMAKDKAEKPAKAEKATAVKSITKGQFITEIAETTALSKAQVSSVFDTMSEIIVKQLSKKGPGVIAIPGLLKLKARRVPAAKGGKSVPNRFKPGEMTVTKDKPAHTKVSVRALKGLKESLK